MIIKQTLQEIDVFLEWMFAHSCIGPETNCWPRAPCYNRKSCFSWYLSDQTSGIPKVFTTCQIYLVPQGEHTNNCQIWTNHAKMCILYFHNCKLWKNTKRHNNPNLWRKLIFHDLKEIMCSPYPGHLENAIGRSA